MRFLPLFILIVLATPLVIYWEPDPTAHGATTAASDAPEPETGVSGTEVPVPDIGGIEVPESGEEPGVVNSMDVQSLVESPAATDPADRDVGTVESADRASRLAGSPASEGGVGSGSGDFAETGEPEAPPEAKGVGAPPLDDDIGGIIDGMRWPGARWSVLAVSLDRGDTLFARGHHDTLVPASNVKLLTSAAALHHLGPDFRYPTYLLTDAPVEDGILKGNLVLYGTGDPSLSDRFFPESTTFFVEMARSLEARGIHTIEGDVVGDGTFFDGPSLGPEWNQRDLNDWFAAPVSALSFNENVVTLRIAAAAVAGQAPEVHTIPADAGLSIVNQARTVAGAGRRPMWASRRAPDEPIIIEGEMGVASADVWRVMTVYDPPMYASAVLRRTLEDEGIRVLGKADAVRSRDASIMSERMNWAPAMSDRSTVRVLATHLSPPLIELLGVVNRASHNLYAELVMMTLGRIVNGDGSFSGGAGAIRQFLEEQVKVEPGSVVLMDGSGLSRQNRVSAGAFVATVAYMKESGEWEAFLSTLPVAGERRGLGRMYRSAAAGNLRAKTGTIDRVSALSGTVLTADGETVGFSILSNDVPSTSAAKRIEDRIGITLATFRRPAITTNR